MSYSYLQINIIHLSTHFINHQYLVNSLGVLPAKAIEDALYRHIGSNLAWAVLHSLLPSAGDA